VSHQTARRFERLDADIVLFTAVVTERAEALLVANPTLSKSAARMAAREQLLAAGHRTYAKVVSAVS
jgi:hypothetical protein